MSLKRAFYIFISLMFSVSILIIAAGTRDLIKVRKDLKVGTKSAENLQSIENSDSLCESTESHTFGSPIGLLSFSSHLNCKIAIYDGLTIENLKYGAAKSHSSAYPCSCGNCVLYGHRDSAFRYIPKLKVGDFLEVKCNNKTLRYTVKNIFITDPLDDKIFQNTDKSKITLVTCYPFTFVGPAPKRCVVEAYS